MPFNGSGVFNRLYNWVSDAAASINILASRMDGEMDGFATGLSNCITKDGQTTVTANLPMGGYKHTGVAVATLRDQYASAGQLQDGALTYTIDTGSSSAYAIGLTPAISSYATGMRVAFKTLNTNSGAATLSINGLTATSIRDSAGNVLSAGDVVANQIIEVIYDGTYFRIISNNDVSVTETFDVIGNELFNFQNFT